MWRAATTLTNISPKTSFSNQFTRRILSNSFKNELQKKHHQFVMCIPVGKLQIAPIRTTSFDVFKAPKTQSRHFFSFLKNIQSTNQNTDQEERVVRYTSDDITFQNLIKTPLSNRRNNRSFFFFCLFYLLMMQFLVYSGYILSSGINFEQDIEDTDSDEEAVRINAYYQLQILSFTASISNFYRFKTKEYSEAMIKGLKQDNYIIFTIASNILNQFAMDSHWPAEKFIDEFDWEAIAKTIKYTDQALPILNLMASLASRPNLAMPMIAKDCTYLAGDALRKENPELHTKAAHVIAILSRSDAANRYLVEDLPELYKIMNMYEQSNKQVYNICKEAIKNIMTSASLDEELKKKAQELTIEIPMEKLAEILKYERTPYIETSHSLNSIICTTITAIIWGSARWSFYRRAISWNTLRVRVPLTVFGSLLYTAVVSAETELVGNIKTDRDRNVIQPAASAITSVILWFTFNVCPYAIIPSLSYTIYQFMYGYLKDPLHDKRWDDMRTPEKQGLISKWLNEEK